jgi:hypothetical protein
MSEPPKPSEQATDRETVRAFAFRPWVRNACAKAMSWGVGVVLAIGLIAWLSRVPGSSPISRAFGALLGYSLLFWVSLAKIWWTAGRPAVVIGESFLGYQPLVTFRLRRVPFERWLECERRPDTASLRVVHVGSRSRARQLFVNLGVIQGRSELLELLGRRLAAHGLEPVAGKPHAWKRPGWDEEGETG